MTDDELDRLLDQLVERDDELDRLVDQAVAAETSFMAALWDDAAYRAGWMRCPTRRHPDSGTSPFVAYTWTTAAVGDDSAA